MFIVLDQGWATDGPREYFVGPANTFETSVNLSYDDKTGNKCRMKEPKSLHVTIIRAYVSLHRRVFRLNRG